MHQENHITSTPEPAVEVHEQVPVSNNVSSPRIELEYQRLKKLTQIAEQRAAVAESRAEILAAATRKDLAERATELRASKDFSATVSIDLGKGETTELGLGLGDDPESIAAQFIASYEGLDPSLLGVLTQQLSNRLLELHQLAYKSRSSQGNGKDMDTLLAMQNELHELREKERVNRSELFELKLQRAEKEYAEEMGYNSIFGVVPKDARANGAFLPEGTGPVDMISIPRNTWRRLVESKKMVMEKANQDREALVKENERLRELVREIEKSAGSSSLLRVIDNWRERIDADKPRLTSPEETKYFKSTTTTTSVSMRNRELPSVSLSPGIEALAKSASSPQIRSEPNLLEPSQVTNADKHSSWETHTTQLRMLLMESQGARMNL